MYTAFITISCIAILLIIIQAILLAIASDSNLATKDTKEVCSRVALMLCAPIAFIVMYNLLILVRIDGFKECLEAHSAKETPAQIITNTP